MVGQVPLDSDPATDGGKVELSCFGVVVEAIVTARESLLTPGGPVELTRSPTVVMARVDPGASVVVSTVTTAAAEFTISGTAAVVFSGAIELNSTVVLSTAIFSVVELGTSGFSVTGGIECWGIWLVVSRVLGTKSLATVCLSVGRLAMVVTKVVVAALSSADTVGAVELRALAEEFAGSLVDTLPWLGTSTVVGVRGAPNCRGGTATPTVSPAVSDVAMVKADMEEQRDC